MIKKLLKKVVAQRYKNRINKENVTLILMYHEIGYEKKNKSIVKPKDFESQMQILIELGFKFISLDDLVLQIRNKEMPNSKQVVITFDDGSKGVYDYGKSIFVKYGIKPTIFLTKKFINKVQYFSYSKIPPSIITKDEYIKYNGFEIKYMSANEIKDLHNVGVCFGAHTLSHVHLTTLEPNYMDVQIIDIKDYLIQEFGFSVKHFAYPYGDYNELVVNKVKHYYDSAVTVVPNKIRDSNCIYELPRIGIQGDDWAFMKRLYDGIFNDKKF